MTALWKNYICERCATTARTPPGREIEGPCPVCGAPLVEVSLRIRKEPPPNPPGSSNTQHF